ncbi:MAG: hypothetical protein KKB79_02355 [Nanoarchaeota archaeon]|nr:hypothetical protein [Nanoarchaeota archaeon]
MANDSDFSERRNKRKVKRKENRKYPYKKGGRGRTIKDEVKGKRSK